MRFLLLLFACMIAFMQANAHPMPNTLINIRVGDAAIGLDINMPAGDLADVIGVDSSADFTTAPYRTRLAEYLLQHLKSRGMDGQEWSVSIENIEQRNTATVLSGTYSEIAIQVNITPPAGADLRHWVLYYDAIIHQLVTHKAIVHVSQDWARGIHASPAQIAVIEMDMRDNQIYPQAIALENGSYWEGFKSMALLGMQHIAEGTDHLMFLLLLLVVAPLRNTQGQWMGFGGRRFSILRLIKIVSAFTLGHSLTLAICSLGWLQFSEYWVEICIAISVLISAIHTIRPIFFGKEMWVAVGFGLVHGMAFSDTLTALDLNFKQLLLSILGFNLGIEIIQLAIILVLAPLLIGFSRQPAYAYFRIASGLLGITAALYWIIERFLGV
jgi:hypothetical protein